MPKARQQETPVPVREKTPLPKLNVSADISVPQEQADLQSSEFPPLSSENSKRLEKGKMVTTSSSPKALSNRFYLLEGLEAEVSDNRHIA